MKKIAQTRKKRRRKIHKTVEKILDESPFEKAIKEWKTKPAPVLMPEMNTAQRAPISPERPQKAYVPRIELKAKDPDKIMTGANAILLIDGQPMPGITRLRIELDAGDVAKVKIELLGHMHALLLGHLESKFCRLIPDGEDL